jgi:uncharacterized protein YjbI with pentapeptide repeats
MLFESQQFDTRFKKPVAWSDHIFRYCDFANIAVEGGDVDSVFIGCTIEKCEWYWGLFNGAVFVNVTFRDCTFRGTAFSGSKFVECKFSDCHFIKDNLGSDCSFDDVAWYKCVQENCGLLAGEFRNGR